MGISKALGSGLAVGLAVFSLTTGARAQALPVLVGPGDTYTITTPTTNNLQNFGTVDVQAPNGALTVDGSSLNAGTLLNSGSVVTGSGSSLNNDGSIQSSGTFTNNATLNNFSGGTVVNSGTYNENSSFNNYSGATLANDGTLTVNSLISNDGAIENSGTMNLTGPSYVYGAGSFTQTGGALTVDGLVQQNLAINGGTLGGSGYIFGNVNVDGATVSPGNSPGILQVNGDVTFTDASTFSAELGGLVYGTEYDRLDVFGGTASLAAGTTFDVDFYGGFNAGLGDTFDVLVADSILSPALSTMLFDFSGATLGSGLAWNSAIVDLDGRDALRLSVVESQVAAVPAPGAALLFGTGLLGLGLARRRRREAR